MIYLVKLGDPRPRSADDQGNQLFINQAELVHCRLGSLAILGLSIYFHAHVCDVSRLGRCCWVRFEFLLIPTQFLVAWHYYNKKVISQKMHRRLNIHVRCWWEFDCWLKHFTKNAKTTWTNHIVNFATNHPSLLCTSNPIPYKIYVTWSCWWMVKHIFQYCEYLDSIQNAKLSFKVSCFPVSPRIF